MLSTVEAGCIYISVYVSVYTLYTVYFFPWSLIFESKSLKSVIKDFTKCML